MLFLASEIYQKCSQFSEVKLEAVPPLLWAELCSLMAHKEQEAASKTHGPGNLGGGAKL